MPRQDRNDQPRERTEIHQGADCRQDKGQPPHDSTVVADAGPLGVGRCTTRPSLGPCAADSGTKSASSRPGASQCGPTARSFTIPICSTTMTRMAPRASQKSIGRAVKCLCERSMRYKRPLYRRLSAYRSRKANARFSPNVWSSHVWSPSCPLTITFAHCHG
jgi:hypothetical protein